MAKKPSYEVGTSSKLSFATKLESKYQRRTDPLSILTVFPHPGQAGSKVSEETAQVWTLSANDVFDDDIVSMIIEIKFINVNVLICSYAMKHFFIPAQLI